MILCNEHRKHYIFFHAHTLGRLVQSKPVILYENIAGGTRVVAVTYEIFALMIYFNQCVKCVSHYCFETSVEL